MFLIRKEAFFSLAGRIDPPARPPGSDSPYSPPQNTLRIHIHYVSEAANPHALGEAARKRHREFAEHAAYPRIPMGCDMSCVQRFRCSQVLSAKAVKACSCRSGNGTVLPCCRRPVGTALTAPRLEFGLYLLPSNKYGFQVRFPYLSQVTVMVGFSVRIGSPRKYFFIVMVPEAELPFLLTEFVMYLQLSS